MMRVSQDGRAYPMERTVSRQDGLSHQQMAVALTAAGLVLLLLLFLAYFVAPVHFAPDLTAGDLAAIPADERLAAHEDRLATQNQVRVTSLQLVGSIVVLGGAIAAWIQLHLRRRDQHIAREGQITERFTRAIDQLGKADSLDVRLGGIHALGRIANVSYDDRPAVIEILAAYIRRKAPTSEADVEVPPRPQDVHSAIGVLSRALAKAAEADQYVHVDLHAAEVMGIDLSGANLARANLHGADLTRANLQGANLNQARLIDADLTHANLQGANLTDARLIVANLSRAKLQAANLTNASLTNANLTRADLTNATLARAEVTGALFTDASLTGVVYSELQRAAARGMPSDFSGEDDK